MEITHAQAVRLVTKHGGIRAAARHAGISYSTLRRRYHNIKGLEKTRLQHISKEPCAQGPKSLEDFRAAEAVMADGTHGEILVSPPSPVIPGRGRRRRDL